MNNREELLELSGQIINGMMSADNSLLFKAIDRTLHKNIAENVVSLAHDIQKEIDKIY